MISKKSLALYLLIIGFAFPGVAQVVATIGKKKITKKEFDRRYEETASKSLQGPPDKRLFLEDLIRLEIGLQEGRKVKIEKDPLVVQRYEQIRYAAYVEKVLGKQVENIKISENEMKKYYTQTPELRTQHILISIPNGATLKQREEARNRAREILKDVKASKKAFSELVALYTDDVATKRNGGDIGWQSRLTIVPQYYDAAKKLKKGQISNVVETKFGFHIIKLVDRNTYKKANKRHLRQVIFDKKRAQIFDRFFNGLKKKYKISINEKLLK
ncbi:MAG: peptidylprolyl isomerase [Bdellovibrionales bacterium]